MNEWYVPISMADPNFAIIAERDKGAYKLYYNGNKKNQSIVSVRSYLSENTKQAKDKLLYIQLKLEKELISYAPYKGATIWGQAEYAQNILDDMIANGVETHQASPCFISNVQISCQK